MSNYKEQIEKLVQEEETLLEEYYNRRLNHLDNELKVRFGLGDAGFTIVEPKYDYENTPEYIEHQKASLELAVLEEKAKIKAALNNIERKRLQRAEQEELLKERDN